MKVLIFTGVAMMLAVGWIGYGFAVIQERLDEGY